MDRCLDGIGVEVNENDWLIDQGLALLCQFVLGGYGFSL